MVRLKIGLSQRILYHKDRAYDSIEHGWYSWLKEHTLFFIPNKLEQDFIKLAEELDAFIITGGDADPIRVAVELNLATIMAAQGKPVVGICHGCFLITRVFNGRLDDIDNHMDTEHIVIYNNQQYNVNSHHTQCIAHAPPGVTVLATDLQGHCEAWIKEYVGAVVWHPERMKKPWLPEEIKNLLKG